MRIALGANKNRLTKASYADPLRRNLFGPPNSDDGVLVRENSGRRSANYTQSFLLTFARGHGALARHDANSAACLLLRQDPTLRSSYPGEAK